MKKFKDILVTALLMFCFAGLLTYNIVSFELFGRVALARMEMHAALEAQQQEKIYARQITRKFIELRNLTKIQDAADIIEFDARYVEIKKDYLSGIGSISEEFEQKVANIDDIRILTGKRIRIAEKFKEELGSIGTIPEPLDDFYSSLLEFADNDIFTWKEILMYYSTDFSMQDGLIDNNRIKELYMENQDHYREVEELQAEIYSEYGLESFL